MPLTGTTTWKIENGRDGMPLKNIYINALCHLYDASKSVRE